MNTKDQLLKNTSLLSAGAFSVGALYVNGFYINSIFISNFGIFRTELLRLDYVKIGLTFTLITLGIVFIPIGIFYLSYSVRKKSNLPHFYSGIFGNSINTLLFFSLPLFFAFFATSSEWKLNLNNPIWILSTIERSVITFLCISAFGMIIVPALERVLAIYSEGKLKKILFIIIIEPVRYGCILISLFILWKILTEIPWIPNLFRNGGYYFLTAVVFVTGMLSAYLWVREIQSVPGHFLVYILIGFGLVVLYYMSVTSFVYGVYKFIPKNRGGGLPVTATYITPTEKSYLPANSNKVLDGLYGPYYVVEETNEFLFFAYNGMNFWVSSYVPIYGIRKDRLKRIYLEKIEDGFPRFHD